MKAIRATAYYHLSQDCTVVIALSSQRRYANLYLENNLRVPGKTIQCGEAINLSLVDVPAFVYASREDHIVPWRTVFASQRERFLSIDYPVSDSFSFT
jgi:hypothetical protein